MMRCHRWRLVSALAVVAAIAAGAFACGSGADAETTGSVDGGTRRDGAAVDPLEGGGNGDAGVAPTPPSCARYCKSVQKHCTDEHAQYASEDDCLAFCAHVTPGDPSDYEPKKAASLSCRQYYAGSPALTDPMTYCAAAGPFGGGLCGDRCTAFCQIALSACGPDGGAAPYESQPACKTACADFALIDGGADGGGEGLDGPESGDTLNCRLFHLRKTVNDPEACRHLAADSGACR